MPCAPEHHRTGGQVRGELEDQSIRLLGRLESPSEFEQMIIRAGHRRRAPGSGRRGRDGFAEMTGYSLRNGRPNVGLNITTRSRDASTVSVATEARKLVEEIRKELPEGTILDITQDGGKDAENSLQQRHPCAVLRRRFDDLRGLRLPE